MTDAMQLVDEAWALHHELDDAMPMWEADLDQIERWFTVDTEATAGQRSRCAELLDRLEGALAGAPPDAQVSLLTAAAAIRLLDATIDTTAELGLPHPEQGLLGFLHWAINGYALRTAEHGERYHEKLRRFPTAIDGLCSRLEDAAAGGRAPLRRHVVAAIEKLDAMLAADVAEDPLLDQAPPTELDDVAAAAFRDGVAELVGSHTRPALRALRDTLAGASLAAGRGDDEPGLVHRPDGAAEYAAHLAGHARVGLTAARVHEVGRQQLARLDEEWAALGAEHFGVDDPVEVRRRVAAIPGRATAEEVQRDAAAVHARVEAAAPDWFRRVPTSPCVVRTTEHGSLAFYSSPRLDGSRPGTAFFNVSDPTAWGPQLAATVVHEGIPGHHFQTALALEDDSLHTLHRRLFLSAFGEGWSLYVERIGDDMGIYLDAVERFGMLQSDALRATRLVVDTGLHALGWSREQAIATMLTHTGLGTYECTAEVDRYIAVPGQATSYMTGRLAIERARDAARARLGEAFDLAAFHEVVLSRGMISLDALDVLVSNWDG